MKALPMYNFPLPEPQHICGRDDALECCGASSQFEMVTENKGEAMRADGNKVRLDLLPLQPIWDVGRVLSYGSIKYADRNWEKGMRWSRCWGSALRHLFKWWMGEQCDNESGLPHLAHAACNIMYLQHYESHKVGTDDRP